MSEIVVLSKSELSQFASQVVNITLENLQAHIHKPVPDVMTLPQLCEYLNTTPPTIRNKIKDGLPVSHVLGEKTPRFIKSEIDAWLKTRL